MSHYINVLERLELWEQIEEISQENLLPGAIGEDFNVILSEKEKPAVLKSNFSPSQYRLIIKLLQSSII